MRCREAKKLIHTMPKGGCQETLRPTSGHLANCEACRKLLGVSQKAEEILAARKIALDQLADRHPISKSQALAKLSPALVRRGWPLRLAWAGAAGVVALLLAVAAIHYLGGDGEHPPMPVPHRASFAPVTRAMAEAAASSILEKLAEAELRYEAPPPRLPSGPPEVPWEPPRSRLHEQCSLASARTLARIAESQTNLTWRNGS